MHEVNVFINYLYFEVACKNNNPVKQEDLKKAFAM